MLISLLAGTTLVYFAGRALERFWPVSAATVVEDASEAGLTDGFSEVPEESSPGEQSSPGDESAQAVDDRGTSDDDPVDAEQARDEAIRFNIKVSTAGTALLVGAHFFPPLVVPGVGVLCYSFSGILRHSWSQLSQEGKLGVSIIDLVAIGGMMASGAWTSGASATMTSSLADWLARQTERRSRADLTNAFGTRARTVRRIRDGVVVETPWETLEVGDVVLVDAGETVPIDGTIIDGMGSLDQQSLTGEALPVDRNVGDEVFASTMLLNGRLQVRATRSGRDTLASELVKLLGEIERTRAHGATRAQELVEEWIPATLVGSAIGLLLFGPGGAIAVSCAGIGYGLRYSGPTAVLRHLRIALNEGMLVRDGHALERLAQTNVVVFDKTGTLTSTTPEVRRITRVGQLPEVEILRLAAIAERHQQHPIGRALRNAAAALELDSGEIESASIYPGMGLSVVIEGRSVLVGSARLLVANGIRIDEQVRARLAADQRPDEIVVYIAVDGELAGTIELAPTLRPHAHRVIKTLQERGLEVVVLSGDHEGPTAELAKTLGVDRYFAGVLPQGKAEVIKGLQSEGKVVVFIGDGINDAIALSTADVAISLKGAASVAEDVAAILMLDGDLAQLPKLFEISDSLHRNIDRCAVVTIATGIASVVSVFTVGVDVGRVVLLYQAGIAASMVNALLAPVSLSKNGDAVRNPIETANGGIIVFRDLVVDTMEVKTVFDDIHENIQQSTNRPIVEPLAKPLESLNGKHSITSPCNNH